MSKFKSYYYTISNIIMIYMNLLPRKGRVGGYEKGVTWVCGKLEITAGCVKENTWWGCVYCITGNWLLPITELCKGVCNVIFLLTVEAVRFFSLFSFCLSFFIL